MMLFLWGLLFPLNISLFPSMLHPLLPWWLGILCWLSQYIPFAVQAKIQTSMFTQLVFKRGFVRFLFYRLPLTVMQNIMHDVTVFKWRCYPFNWLFGIQPLQCEISSTLISMFKCYFIFLSRIFLLINFFFFVKCTNLSDFDLTQQDVFTI